MTSILETRPRERQPQTKRIPWSALPPLPERPHPPEAEVDPPRWFMAAGLCAAMFAAGWFLQAKLIPALRPATETVLPMAQAQALTRNSISAPAAESVPPLLEATETTPAPAEPVLAAEKPAAPPKSEAAVNGNAVAAAPATLNVAPPVRTADFTNRARVRFVAAAGQANAIAPGLTLEVRAIRAETNRFDGVLRSATASLPLKNQVSLQAFAFGSGGEAVDVIVTGVTTDSLTGYVILPPAERRP